MKFDYLLHRIIERMLESPFFYLVPDEFYLKIKFFVKMGRRLNLNHPVTFNEKLQWLKLYDRKESYSTLVDKIAVKQFAVSIMGRDAVLATLDTWTDADKLDFRKLPDSFVLKCNHDSGSTIICKNKNDVDLSLIKKKLHKSLKKNYFYSGREYPYKKIQPMIFAEDIILSDTSVDDYKVFCFEGIPKFIIRYSDAVDHKRAMDFYDTSWNRLNIRKPGHPTGSDVEAPKCLGKMIEYSKQFSYGFHFLRVDFVYANNQLLFGELTLFPSSGFNSFEPSKYDETFGSWIKLEDNINDLVK